jgi:hypothetical protein
MTAPKPVYGQYGALDNEREALDWYPSPPEAAKIMLAHATLPIRGPVLDAGAGAGALMTPLEEAGIATIGVDLVDRGAPPWLDVRVGVDFLTLPDPLGCRSVIMNPPFEASDAFVRRALAMLPDGGRVYALLRHTWICAKKRRDLLPMLREQIICGRLKMLPAGRADLDKGHSGTVDFAWFVFERGWDGPAFIRRADGHPV